MKEFSVHDSLLGKEASMPERYDASLLFRIPRAENRIKYDLTDGFLPFIGVDVWNCYEFSLLTQQGLPVSRVMKMTYTADSEYLVESKSLKLYLNSFNMERFDATAETSLRTAHDIITRDLSHLLETPVNVSFLDRHSTVKIPFCDIPDISYYIPQTEQEAIRFEHYRETPALLSGIPAGITREYAFRTDLLRSNCRVTNQPDWGDLFVRMHTDCDINFPRLLQYLVSFRRENHFHEEVVEMIYKRFWDTFAPTRLTVAAMYTRRGGIDINPIRCSHPADIDTAFTTNNVLLDKTLRQ